MENKKLLTAAQLMADSPASQDVWCESWGGSVRLSRLPGPEKLRLALAADELRGEEGGLELTNPAAWKFAVDVLAASIVDADGVLQFADPSARAWLDNEVGAVANLLGPALALNRLGAAETAADVEAAKKN